MFRDLVRRSCKDYPFEILKGLLTGRYPRLSPGVAGLGGVGQSLKVQSGDCPLMGRSDIDERDDSSGEHRPRLGAQLFDVGRAPRKDVQWDSPGHPAVTKLDAVLDRLLRGSPIPDWYRRHRLRLDRHILE